MPALLVETVCGSVSLAVMTKKRKYLESAEKLYMERGLTLAELAERVPVSYATLRKWKRDGDWDLKKQEFDLSRDGFHQELYELGRKFSTEIRKDFDEGKTVSPARLYALGRIMDIVDKTHKYEEKITRKIKSKNNASLKDLVRNLNDRLFGDPS